MPVVRRLFVSHHRGAFFRNGTAVERCHEAAAIAVHFFPYAVKMYPQLHTYQWAVGIERWQESKLDTEFHRVHTEFH
jgi:hypothetical protein